MELKKGKIFIISAPSGAGKTTLTRELLSHFNFFEFSVSATTRPPRIGEIEGRDYYFISVPRFRELRDRNAFLEWEEVYAGRYYGTLKSEISRILDKGCCPILDLDVVGGVNVKQHYQENAVSIFIQPPNIETLRERLRQRGTESFEEIERRYEKAREEISYAHRFDYVIVNDHLEHAVQELLAIVQEHVVIA